MKHISFEHVAETDYLLTGVVAFPQQFRQDAVFQPPKFGRPNSGLMYILDGECIMEAGGKTFCAEMGQIVYLPQGYSYRLTFKKSPNNGLKCGKITNHLVNFSAKTTSGEGLALSDEIMVLTPDDSKYFKEVFEHISKNCENAIYPPALLKASVFELITELSKQFKRNFISSENDVLLLSAIKYISENYFKKELSVAEISKMHHISESTLRRIFRASLNTSPKEYINTLRLKRAKLLLKSDSFSIAEIAGLVGFEDSSYFSRFFKKQTGINPTKYR